MVAEGLDGGSYFGLALVFVIAALVFFILAPKAQTVPVETKTKDRDSN